LKAARSTSLQRTMSAFTSSGSDWHSLQICRACPLPLNCSLALYSPQIRQ